MKRFAQFSLLTILLSIFLNPFRSYALDLDLCKSECFKSCCGRTASQCTTGTNAGSDAATCNNSICTEDFVSAAPEQYCPLVVKDYELLQLGDGWGSSGVKINNYGEAVFNNVRYRQPANRSAIPSSLPYVAPKPPYSSFFDLKVPFRALIFNGINDSGAVVGHEYGYGPECVYNTVISIFGFEDIEAASGYAYPLTINNNITIGGRCVPDAICPFNWGTNYACIFKDNQTTLIQLQDENPQLPNSEVGVYAINDDEQAAGTSIITIDDETLLKAFYRSETGDLTTISYETETQSKAYDMNNERIVVGEAQFDDASFQAFTYNQQTASLVSLRTKLGNPTYSTARAINEHNIVAGFATFDDETTKVFTFDASDENNTPHFIEAINGFSIRSVDDINDSGEITGSQNLDNKIEAFMLRPLKLRESERSNLDFDFDGVGDFSVWRPSLGGWFASQVSQRFLQWGLGQDIPLLGNFDSDVNKETVVFRPSEAIWYLNKGKAPLTSGVVKAVQHGLPGDVPLLGDTNGDNQDDYIVWRPFLQNGSSIIQGQWYIKPSAGTGAKEIQWGLRGDLPFTADFDGDGLADLGVWRNTTGEWYILKSSTNYSKESAMIIHKQWGLAGDHPLAGDYDGDGLADLAVWRPSNGTWYICPSRYDLDCSFATAIQWGLPTDTPVSVAFNGDHTLSLAVYRSYHKVGRNVTEGTWYVRDLKSDEVTVKKWGLRNDVPLKLGTRDTMKRLGLL